MLRIIKGFTIATAIVFLSVVPALAAQADNVAPPQPATTLQPKDPSVDVSMPQGVVPLGACDSNCAPATPSNDTEVTPPRDPAVSCTPSSPCGPVDAPNAAPSSDSSYVTVNHYDFIHLQNELQATQITARLLTIGIVVVFIVFSAVLWIVIVTMNRRRGELAQVEDKNSGYGLMEPLQKLK